MIKLHNVRYGYATNSSSSHSVILLSKDEIVKDRLAGMDGEGRYGWGNFILASSEEKLKYLAVQLYNAMVRTSNLPGDFAIPVIESWLGIDLSHIAEPSDWDSGKLDVYVDHQSQWSFSPETFTKEFVEDLKKFILREDVVITGGNDNEGDTPADFIQGTPFAALQERREAGDDFRVKKDGSYYVFFNAATGFKTRFSFENDPNAGDYEKSSVPELVDLKLTNYCPYMTSACAKFCYEGSNQNGKHADTDFVMGLLRDLGGMGVMELSMAGGSLEYHPDIVKILKAVKSYRMVANITVLNAKGMKANPELLQAIQDTVNGIGVSVHNVASVENVEEVKELVGDRYPKKDIMAHVVVGATPMDEMVKILKACFEKQIQVLLLGYKTVGNAATQTPHPIDQDELIAAVKKLREGRWIRLSVDTLFLQQFPTFCDKLGVSRVLTTSPEGKFSMYIDAVEQVVSPSSYVPRDQMIPLEFKLGYDKKPNYYGMGEQILKHYVTF